ncbi:hypothetical protein OQA88_12632 [Cercophora sp. LCS_1]
MASFLTYFSSAFHEGSLEQIEIAKMLDPTITYHAAPALQPADRGFDFIMEVSSNKVKVKASEQFGQVASERLSHSVMESTAEAQQQARQQATVVTLSSIATIGSVIGLAVWRVTGRQAPKTVVPSAGKINATRTTVPRHALRAYRARWNGNNNNKK